jgi:hypothetical protein
VSGSSVCSGYACAHCRRTSSHRAARQCRSHLRTAALSWAELEPLVPEANGPVPSQRPGGRKGEGLVW